ncbi:MAG: hypothetical protein WC822_01455 [Candidatus Paceibacterota bacterium]
MKLKLKRKRVWGTVHLLKHLKDDEVLCIQGRGVRRLMERVRQIVRPFDAYIVHKINIGERVVVTPDGKETKVHEAYLVRKKHGSGVGGLADKMEQDALPQVAGEYEKRRYISPTRRRGVLPQVLNAVPEADTKRAVPGGQKGVQ